MSDITLDQLLKTVVAHGSSDLHLVVGTEPQIRISGALQPINMAPLTKNMVQDFCYSVMTESQKKELEETKELDFAIDVPNGGRFRGNIYFEKNQMAAAFRIIPTKVPTLDEMAMPLILKELSNLEKGLVLVTGPTGSGKSTTMASLINEINMNHKKHILTIEDPVEFVHEHKKSIISQRNVGSDTGSFSKALKYALRQDPDVIYIGEMRDVETIRAGITAAETGHLVFGTLHTNSAPQTINRIINVFPADEQALIRTQLSMTLQSVVSQFLVPKIAGGRKCVQEILINTPAIANLIRDDKVHQVYAQMQLNQQNTKMQTQSQELVKLVRGQYISPDDAVRFATNKDEVKKTLGIY
ncbi:MAG: type IV pilus twitching motility protein PilT [Campylobacterales bacterium]|nr:type IV pilus twitching motility protein PilT [Campylobacterales bacterium]